MARELMSVSKFKSIPPFAEPRRTRQREVTVQELVRSLPEYLSPLIDGNIEVRIIEAEQELPVLVDVAQIKRVLGAFIETARSTMPDGGYLTITTGTMQFNGTYIYGHVDHVSSCAFISVSDTGSGMHERELAGMFEPGSSAAATRGMGLPMAYHTIKQHNGSINLESRPGQGTTVKIYLPLIQKKPSRAEKIPLPPAHSFASLPMQNY